MGLKVKGRKESKESLKNLPDKMAAVTEKSLKKDLEFLATRAKLNAPIDTGALRESIRAEVRRSRLKITGEIVADAPYALQVHEEEHQLGLKSAQQPTTEEGGVGNKFIERVVNFHADKIDKDLGESQLAELKKLERGKK